MHTQKLRNASAAKCTLSGAGRGLPLSKTRHVCCRKGYWGCKENSVIEKEESSRLHMHSFTWWQGSTTPFPEPQPATDAHNRPTGPESHQPTSHDSSSSEDMLTHSEKPKSFFFLLFVIKASGSNNCIFVSHSAETCSVKRWRVRTQLWKCIDAGKGHTRSLPSLQFAQLFV